MDGIGHEGVLADKSYEMEKERMNKIVFSQIEVATFEGTAHHIVYLHSITKYGHEVWSYLV